MNLCSHKAFARKNCTLRAYVAPVTASFLLITSLCYSYYSYADVSNITEDNNSSVISISSTDERYSLVAEQAKLSDVLLELGKAADFKLKVFEQLSIEQQNWDYNSMPLSQLLTNLLRGYSTVMLYEEAHDKTLENNTRKLKELWLIASDDNSGVGEQSINNIEIKLEPPATRPIDYQNLTPQQQYEIAHIDNLEGLTGDDVIESLKLTLVTENDPVIRKRAVVALSDIGGTHVLDALESGLSDSSGEVRTQLAKSFAEINHQRSMLALGQLLMGDHDVKVRQEAVRALYQQNGPAARSFIEAALNDKDDSVKKVAGEILQQWPLAPENH